MTFRSASEAQLIQAVVHDNPRKPDEGPLRYIERIAILSGLMAPSRAGFTENTTLGRPVEVGVRLPYREPGEDDE